jgi:hypothetical protein
MKWIIINSGMHKVVILIVFLILLSINVSEVKAVCKDPPCNKEVPDEPPFNTPPSIPSIPSGPDSGAVGFPVTFSTSATDSDGNAISYTFDWGDGTKITTPYIPSGDTASSSHTWFNIGTYSIKVMAGDGGTASSAWSAMKTINISLPPEHQREIIETEGTSVSRNTPSSIFPPNHNKLYPLAVPGSKIGLSKGKEYQTVELRGWLRNVEPICNYADPDWHYDLEIDPAWTDFLGIDLNQIIKVGNLITLSYINPSDTGSPQQIETTPLIHIELNGWRRSEHPNEVPPEDWGFSDADSQRCGGVLWAYNPLRPLPWQPNLTAGQYVRIVGSLVTDEPHFSEAQVPTWLCRNFNVRPACSFETAQVNSVKQTWGGNKAETDPDNVARWTEVHPPDIIVVMKDKNPTETLRGIALAAGNCLLFCGTESIDEDIYPPGPRPSASATFRVKELVGPETNYGTIVEGNTDKNGAEISYFPDHVHIHAKVQGQIFWGAPGKFKALYRVFWEDKATPPQAQHLLVRVEPYPIQFGSERSVTDTLTVYAEDSQTHTPVSGRVMINGKDINSTNTLFTYTFTKIKKQDCDYNRKPPCKIVDDVYPSGIVTATGYEEADIDFGFSN